MFDKTYHLFCTKCLCILVDTPKYQPNHNKNHKIARLSSIYKLSNSFLGKLYMQCQERKGSLFLLRRLGNCSEKVQKI